MCYHYSLSKKQDEIMKMIQVEWEMPFEPVYHAGGFSFPLMPVITMDEPSKVRAYYWGFIPPWAPSLAEAQKIRAQALNARSETLWEKPLFRSSVVAHRCIVPADGFFEWMEHRKKKFPHFIHLKDNELFGFAGICSHWTDKETGELLKTFAIITTDANPFMARIHNVKKRMPVIFRQDQWKQWLDPKMEKHALAEMLRPCDETVLSAFTISKHITERGADTNVPEVIHPWSYPELLSGEQASLFDG
jgi:putative SOS response-associated peptidase YedK